MISFIIPAHNATAYLKRAIESIESDANACGGQKKIEIIIVENGSTDDTYLLAEDMASLYSNITAARSQKGVSAARNKGIDIAKGEWIFFLDADDFILKGSIAKLLHDADRMAPDWILYGHVNGSRKIQLAGTEKTYNADDIERCRAEFISNPTRYLQVWAKLFKRDIIIENNIRFDQELRLAEDSDFSIRYSAFCKCISVSDNIVYNYSIDNNSTVRSVNDDKINDYIFSMERTVCWIEHESKTVKEAFSKYILMHFNIAMVRGVYDKNIKKNAKEKIGILKDTISRKIFSHSLRNIKFKECSSLRMIPIFLIKIKCYRLAGVVYSIRAKQNAKESNNV